MMRNGAFARALAVELEWARWTLAYDYIVEVEQGLWAHTLTRPEAWARVIDYLGGFQ